MLDTQEQIKELEDALSHAESEAKKLLLSKDDQLDRMQVDVQTAIERSLSFMDNLRHTKNNIQKSFEAVDARYATYNASNETRIAELKGTQDRCVKDLKDLENRCAILLRSKKGPENNKVLRSHPCKWSCLKMVRTPLRSTIVKATYE